MANQSDVLEIILVGFPGLREEFFIPMSLVMLLIYMASLTANGTVIAMVVLKKNLHKPMYIITANLSCADLLYDTVTLPKIVAKYWFGVTMTFPECLIQMYLTHSTTSTDAYIFMFMAIDRYFAICQPLRYSSIISYKVVAISCLACWVLASSTGFAALVMNSQAPPCGYNRINTIMCTNIAVTALACTDVSHIKKATFMFFIVILIVTFCVNLVSYGMIFNIIRVSANRKNWKKVLSTCTTHWIVMTLQYAPRWFVYMSNEVGLVYDVDVNVVLLCFYSYVPHICNPIIFTFRNEAIIQTLVSFFSGIMNFKARNRLFSITVTK